MNDRLPSTETAAPAASHDTAPPAELLAAMTTGWQPRAKGLPKPIAGWRDHARRRAALSAKFPGEVLLVPTGKEKVRANDTNFRFRPGSDFAWLTGCHEPDCVLALVPEGAGHRSVLFVEPNPGRSDATFFTDRNKGELWVGPRLGVPESRARYGVDEARPLAELGAAVATWVRPRVLRGYDPAVDAVAGEPERDDALATALSELRLIKDPREIRALSAAIDATQRGFEDSIRALRAPPYQLASTERLVEGVFGLRARCDGNDVGYGTIAAAGHHACTLHWTRNDGPLTPGDLILLDAGVEGPELYTADVTRTLPISGRFSKEQRQIYALVLASQRAAMREVRPGNAFLAPNRAAMAVLVAGLEKLGILAADPEWERKQLHKRYTLHNVSHMLGIDVHDCAKARQEAYKYGNLEAGMVLTVEPGLYFQPDDLTVPARYRGIGVRIEDDVLVTATGCRVLSGRIPKSIAGIEAWMASLWGATPA